MSFSTASVSMNPADLDIVQRQLSADERIQWVGRPDLSKRFTRSDLPLSLVGVMFALFSLGGIVSSGGSALAGVPFLAVALWVAFGRLIYRGSRKRRTLFAVTDKRVLEIVGSPNRESVNAMYLSAIPSVSTTSAANGSGTVNFGIASGNAARYRNSGVDFFSRGQSGGSFISFYDIPDARSVADLVERLRKG